MQSNHARSSQGSVVIHIRVFTSLTVTFEKVLCFLQVLKCISLGLGRKMDGSENNKKIKFTRMKLKTIILREPQNSYKYITNIKLNTMKDKITLQWKK